MPYPFRFALALVVVGGGAAIARATGADLAAASLLLLVAVVATSLLGLPVGLFSAAVAFVTLNWFFTPPRGSFRIDSGDDFAALVVFVLSAAIVGTVVHLLDRARRDAQRRADETHLRLDLTNRLVEGADLEAALPDIASSLRRLFELTTCRMQVGAIDVTSGTPVPGDAAHVHIAAGPLVVDAEARRTLAPADRDLLEALVAGVGTAIDRLRFETEAREATVAAEVGATRAAFLSGVSHNLRTPLAAVKAAASTLLAPDAQLTPDDREELLHMIRDESERLERLVRNTLALSRIKGGVMQVRLEEVDVSELVGIALRRVAPLATHHHLMASVPEDLPPVRVDSLLIEHVFLNLLENALRFAPPGSEILVTANQDADGDLVVKVVDHGPGVSVADRTRIFDDFTTGGARGEGGGSGLGLGIVRSLVGAHGGTAYVEDTPGGGATFVCTFPQERP
ncbi:MAG: kdpD [Actinomycetia bacterium]|jgi:two-component system sensor histidine kinase KdpD|nr:kdpD [Actinomycetes bacterium]